MNSVIREKLSKAAITLLDVMHADTPVETFVAADDTSLVIEHPRLLSSGPVRSEFEITTTAQVVEEKK
jgi:hypothetical protein